MLQTSAIMVGSKWNPNELPLSILYKHGPIIAVYRNRHLHINILTIAINNLCFTVSYALSFVLICLDTFPGDILNLSDKYQTFASAQKLDTIKERPN